MDVTVALSVENSMKVYVDEDISKPTVYVSLRFANSAEK